MAWIVGYPREKVEWYPTIDVKKCVKCGMCLNCGKEVYEWTDAGPVVSKPFSCVVGCTTCANLCQGKAIQFQDLSELRSLYRREGIWKNVRSQMIEDGKITEIRKTTSS
jgi:NAD-dependent dihydropyrimidine dehydrogenase PreA subunit